MCGPPGSTSPEAWFLHHERWSLTSFRRHTSGHGQVTHWYAHSYENNLVQVQLRADALNIHKFQLMENGSHAVLLSVPSANALSDRQPTDNWHEDGSGTSPPRRTAIPPTAGVTSLRRSAGNGPALCHLLDRAFLLKSLWGVFAGWFEKTPMRGLL